MSGEMLAGQDTPADQPIGEAQNLQPEQPVTEETGSAQAQTDGAEGGEQSPGQQEKTFTQAEVNAIVAREKAREARRALRDLQRQQPMQQPSQPTQQASEEQPQQSQQPRVTKADVEAYLAQQRAQESLNTFLEKAEDAVEKYPDYMTVVSDPRLPFSGEMIEFFAESDVGTELAYHLAKNPQKAFAIARMSSLKAGRELTQLETELKARTKVQTSNAPPPIRPLGANGSSGQKDPADMSPSEFAKWRKEQIARRGR